LEVLLNDQGVENIMVCEPDFSDKTDETSIRLKRHERRTGIVLALLLFLNVSLLGFIVSQLLSHP
jgi:hypothetical protein